MSITGTVRADAFIASIGVDQHLNWDGTVYANGPLELQELNYLGINLVRDSAPASWNLAPYKALADGGVRFDFLVGAAGQDLAQTLSPDIAAMVSLAQYRPGSIFAIEGPNELNGQIVYLNGASSASPATGAAIERYVSQAVRSNATFTAQGVKVFNVTVTNGIGGWSSYVDGLGNLSTSVDYGNWHVYFNRGDQPAANVTSMYGDAIRSAPGKPVVFTEAGYFTAYRDTSGWGGVDEATQAKNTLNLLADAYKLGVAQTYLYELMEGVANPSSTDIENTFGLFHSDGTAKPVATAIHNLTSIIDDKGASALTFATHTLNYTINGLPSTGNSMVLEESTGVFDLLVWNEAQDWNAAAQTQILVAKVNAVVNLGAVYSSVRVFDPLIGLTPIQTLTNVSSVTLGLTDHLLVVEVTESSVSPSDPPPPSPPPSTASPDGTTITKASDPAIVDGGGNRWTLVQSTNQGLQIAVNGAIDTKTMFVVLLEKLGGNMVQKNTAGNWYSEPGPNGPWTAIAAPVTQTPAPDPAPPPAFVPSPDGSKITSASDAPLIDNAGNKWTLTQSANVGLQITANGVVDTRTMFVTVLEKLANSMIQQNTAGNWYSEPGPGGTWTAIAAPTSPPPVVTSHQLVLILAEDRYQGDAKFIAKVDAKQIGSGTVTALHNQGQTQSFTFTGQWSAGQHDVEINFTNDAWEGTATTDRNLYVENVKYDGGSFLNHEVAMFSNGAQHFLVGQL